MIAKGNQRGGGRQLASHLLNAHDNERVEICDLRGSIAQDLHGAFAEWQAQSKATRCEKYLYSLSVNPDQRQGRMTREQYLDYLDRVEKRLGLEGRGRVVVFHEKKDKDGIRREHCHAVWSRIDPQTARAVQISHDRMKLRSVAQEFAHDYERTLPKGMREERGPARHEARAGHADLKEKQQEERTGQSKEQRRAALTEAWQESKNGPELVKAMQRRGYMLARGDARSYVVIDRGGEVHSLARQIAGVKAAAIKERLGLSHSVESLPGVEEAKAGMAQQRAAVQVLVSVKEPAGPTADERRAELAEQQAGRRQVLLEKREALAERHGKEKRELATMQHQEKDGIAGDRAARRPRGLAGFIYRMSGMRSLTAHFQQRQDKARNVQHKAQEAALDRRHTIERREMDRQERDLAAIEKRESRSFETKLKREEFQRGEAAVKASQFLATRFQGRKGPGQPEAPAKEIPKESERERLQRLFTAARERNAPALPAMPATESKAMLPASFDKATIPEPERSAEQEKIRRLALEAEQAAARAKEMEDKQKTGPVPEL